MAGKPGRSGRKPGSGMSAVEHAARGTYKRSVHGPLPPGVIPAPRRPVLVPRTPPLPAIVTSTGPPASALEPADCPEVLSAEGKTLWNLLIAQRPTEKVLGPFVAMYVEAMLAWRRATREITSKGDYGTLGKKLIANPYLRSRREAELTMFKVAQLLGWQGPVPAATPPAPAETPRTRLELFLEARRRRS